MLSFAMLERRPPMAGFLTEEEDELEGLALCILDGL